MPHPPLQEFPSMARYGPATTFTRPVRKWRKEWVPIAAATATATSAAASSTGTVSLASFGFPACLKIHFSADSVFCMLVELNSCVYLLSLDTRQVSVVQGQRQESAKSDNENKANDGEPSSAETEQSNGKANIGDTLMDESQVTFFSN
ncbi:uncharacterized protein [Aegilops tauschii subsp. strangulata]|uniref:uncharacterized protein n=1 Tax=Aegilops tauschii subsp. strangulata TaxID=200361 RepID=UPI001ABC4F1F|nr:uncharacterized protein LOC109751694 [Aegilops tauschii subsp. strangulata]